MFLINPYRFKRPIPTSGLLAYYPLNGDANDASGNGRNGTIVGTPSSVTDRKGNAGSAYHFNDGSTSYFKLPSISGIKSLSFWIKTPFTGPATYYKVDARTGNPNGYWGAGQMNKTGWPIVYIDGGLRPEADLAISSNWTHCYLESTNPFTDDIYFMIRYTGVEGPLLGDLDDVRIYNRALTVEEILALYNE